MATVSYEEQERLGLVKRGDRSNYRSAADLGLPTEQQPPARQATITAIPPARQDTIKGFDWSATDQPYRATRNEHMDIAKGFTYVAMPVSIAASLAVPFAAWVGLSVPIFSLLTLAMIAVTFALSYFGCWILSQFFSHYGIQLAKVLLGYRLLRHDQRERHRHYRRLTK